MQQENGCNCHWSVGYIDKAAATVNTFFTKEREQASKYIREDKRRRAINPPSSLATSLIILLCLVGCVFPYFASAAPPYQDDPEIIALIEKLEAGQSLILPPVNVDAKGLTFYGVDRLGPGQRDYCNKMPYAADRQTALYAGGNHQVPHRMNDVWEYHLGSNSWHLLYEPDGGNPSKHKAAYFLTSRTLVREPNKVLTEKEREQIEAYRIWWDENVVFADGHLTTKRGGPIMPAHTWDAFCYDEAVGQSLWGMGVNPAGQLSTLAYFTGKPLAQLEQQADASYTPMWKFDPKAGRWIHYRTTSPRAALRGMGATMTYLPDLKQSLWYVAAQNVSPHAFEMWLYDGAGDRWTELKPNGGRSIDQLATKDNLSPLSEQQSAYSTKDRVLLAALKNETFAYNVAANAWSKLADDPRVFVHDARSVLAYDSHADQFLLAFPPEGRGKELQLASFSLATKKWNLFEPKGEPVLTGKYGGCMGYYDPRHNVFVIQSRGCDRMWVYRHAM